MVPRVIEAVKVEPRGPVPAQGGVKGRRTALPVLISVSVSVSKRERHRSTVSTGSTFEYREHGSTRIIEKVSGA